MRVCANKCATALLYHRYDDGSIVWHRGAMDTRRLPEPARDDGGHASDRGRQLFTAIAARVDMRFAHPSTHVGAVAAELGVTPRHLQRVLRNACGLNFGQYLRRRRVAEAARLLLGDGMSLRIKEVAARVGLNDTRTLDRHFFREFGMTPGQFRARHLATGGAAPRLGVESSTR